MYNNMSKDGIWKCKIGEKDQIIALTTKVSELQSKLEKQVAAFATQAKTEITPLEIKGPHREKKDGPYTVAPWRMIKKEDTVTNNGKTYHWCTGDHYSGGVKHNGMYADHKFCDHEAWGARIDLNCTNANAANGKAPTVETPKSE